MRAAENPCRFTVTWPIVTRAASSDQRGTVTARATVT